MGQAIIVQARTGSTRLPEKMIKPFYQEKCLIEIVLEKLIKVPDVKVVLATSELERDDVLADHAERLGCVVFRGSEDDVLERFIGAAEQVNTEKILRVCADNPFLSEEHIVELIKKQNTSKADYVSYAFPDGRPTIKSHIGLFAEGTTLSALKKVASLTEEKLYREHVTNFIYSNTDDFNVQLFALPEHLKDKTELRFTLDTKEDFDLLSELYQKQVSENWNLRELIDFVDHNAEIKKVMKAEVEKNSK